MTGRLPTSISDALKGAFMTAPMHDGVDGQILTLRANGNAVDSATRADMIQRSMAGEHLELEIDIIAYTQTSGVQNRKFIRFKPGRMASIARSGVGSPYLRDHMQGDLEAAGGTVIASKLVVNGDTREIHQTVRLTVPWAVQSALQGVTRKFSIGWWPTAAVHCTICKAPVEQCLWSLGHWRGSEHDGQIVEYEFQDAELIETSVVNVPAEPATGVREVRTSASPMLDATDASFCIQSAASQDAAIAAVLSLQALDSTKQEDRPATLSPTNGDDMANEGVTLARINGALALASASTVDDAVAAIEGLRQKANESQRELERLSALANEQKATIAERDATIVEMTLARTLDQADAIIEALRAEGRLLPGSTFEAMALDLKQSGDIAKLEKLAAGLREQPAKVPVGARQSVDENRPSGKSALEPAPRTANGEIDYDAMGEKLPSELRARFAPTAAKLSWAAVFKTPAGAMLWEAAGFTREGVY